MKQISKILCPVLITFLASIGLVHGAPKPNVIVILADDMGWKDAGYNGSEIRTPTLDMLAQTGVQLDRYYAQPTCSPTRASLMTGQAAVRLGIYQPFSKNAENSLPLDVKIMPQYFRDAGYQTIHIGKWHLGRRTRAMLPNARGFDYSYGYLTGGIGYWNHIHGGGRDLNRNGKTVYEEGYATHLFAEEAVQQIKDRDANRPFFLYYALPAPHLPNEAPEDTIAHYKDVPDTNRQIHAAMVEEMDAAIGRVVQVLDEEGIRDNTIIWFSSDNGGLNFDAVPEGVQKLAGLIESVFGNPASNRSLEFIRSNTMDGAADNGPYRRGKGSTYEGGVIVPAMVNWPGKLMPRKVGTRMTVQDVLPTLANIAGLSLAEDHVLDGADQWQTLQTGQGVNVPDYPINGYEGIGYFSGDWKLIEGPEGPELYNLEDDPHEGNDLAADKPDILTEMLAKRDAFPAAPSIHNPIWKSMLDVDTFGGEEDRKPWADVVEE